MRRSRKRKQERKFQVSSFKFQEGRDLFFSDERCRLSSSYKNLIVWQKAKALSVAVYGATERFPKAELYGLTSQIRRAAVSVASNIAEGQGRLTKGEFLQFLGHSRGSLLELETQLSIAFELKFLSEADHKTLEDRIAEVLRVLNGLMDSLRASSSAQVRSVRRCLGFDTRNSKLETKC